VREDPFCSRKPVSGCRNPASRLTQLNLVGLVLIVVVALKPVAAAGGGGTIRLRSVWLGSVVCLGSIDWLGNRRILELDQELGVGIGERRSRGLSRNLNLNLGTACGGCVSLNAQIGL
jgi:hypothetical protein